MKWLNQIAKTLAKEVRNITREWRYHPSYPNEYIIGDLSQGIRIRSSYRNTNNLALLLNIEPKNIQEALTDESWVQAMKEKLTQFEKNEV